jgi:hypothetical protein
MDGNNGEDEILRKRSRRAQKRLGISLLKQFHPRFLEDADTRLHVVRIMRKQVARFMDEAGGHESVQRELLCKHAAFMHIRLESMETEALEGKLLDWGEFTQALNCFVGLLRSLGLERRTKQVGDFQSYIAGKERNGHK